MKSHTIFENEQVKIWSMESKYLTTYHAANKTDRSISITFPAVEAFIVPADEEKEPYNQTVTVQPLELEPHESVELNSALDDANGELDSDDVFDAAFEVLCNGRFTVAVME